MDRQMAHRATTHEYVELFRVSPSRVEWPGRPSRLHFPLAAAVQVALMAVGLVVFWFAIAWGGVVIGTALGLPMHGGLPA